MFKTLHSKMRMGLNWQRQGKGPVAAVCCPGDEPCGSITVNFLTSKLNVRCSTVAIQVKYVP
jgi:hypothetical protein